MDDSHHSHQQQQPLLNGVPITRQGDVVGSNDVHQNKNNDINQSNWIAVDGNQHGHLLHDAEAAHDPSISTPTGEVIVAGSADIDKGSRRARCLRGLKYTVGFLVLLFGVLMVAVQQMGWLDSIDRSIELDGHGNAIEPNTGIKLPLVVEYDAIVPGQGKKKVKHHLIGMSLHVNSVASLHLKIMVMGFYVQWDLGKKVLLPWKNKKIDVSHPDPKLVELVSDGKTLPGTLKMVMTSTLPGMSMRDTWGKDLHEMMEKENVDPNTIKKVDDTFHTWLSRGIHNHDKLEFTWGFNPVRKGLEESLDMLDQEGNDDDDDPTSFISFSFNGNLIQPVEKSHEMIHVIVKDEIIENGGSILNLINLMWDH